jgi:small subunit ribosomal protein S1
MSLSIKQLEKNPWEAISEQYKVGQEITGKVSNVTEFGIFIQLAPGIDGLVHISDFSWTEHIEHPADRYKKGDEVKAVITSINPEEKKISLGIKQLTQNPWEEIEKHYPVGSTVQGKVSKITNFGAFVKLPSGVEGLVHVSELSGSEKIEDVLKLGETREFKVIKVSPEEHKLGLSMRSEAQVAQSAAKEKARKETTAARKEKKAEAPKSQLQIELEKHAARKSEESEE